MTVCVVFVLVRMWGEDRKEYVTVLKAERKEEKRMVN